MPFDHPTVALRHSDSCDAREDASTRLSKVWLVWLGILRACSKSVIESLSDHSLTK